MDTLELTQMEFILTPDQGGAGEGVSVQCSDRDFRRAIVERRVRLKLFRQEGRQIEVGTDRLTEIERMWAPIQGPHYQ